MLTLPSSRTVSGLRAARAHATETPTAPGRNAMALSYRRRTRHRRLSPVFGALVSTLIVVAGLTLATGGNVASAATVGTPTPIVGGQSGRCVDVPNSSTVNGTQVQLWDCGG